MDNNQNQTTQNTAPSDNQSSAQPITGFVAISDFDKQLREDFPVTPKSALTDNELKSEIKEHPQDPLSAILEAEQKKELRLTEVRKTLQTNYKSPEEVKKRYPGNPFEA